jgi:lipopolysaccharide/colanic/teichoic acid biosynthesis glycosyltransferase
MTGPWQISGRSELPWEERQLLDLHYVDHHWLGMDLVILARTLPAVRKRRRSARMAGRTPGQAGDAGRAARVA